jgi:polyhydroxyalkanoate synthesis regulator phasin
MKPTCLAVTVVFLALACHSARAAEKQELLELRNTILNLVDALVEQGVLTQEKASALKQDAALKARAQLAQAAVETGEAQEAPAAEGAAGERVVRVPYVPEFVKDEIRREVREGLRADVTQDVIAKAREERWGTPDALPDWVTAFKLSGDVRLRARGDFAADANIPNSIPDFAEINDAGGITEAGADAFFNVTEDRYRLQTRFRLGVTATVADQIEFGARITTESSPISLNQALGNDYGSPFPIVLDRVYLAWDAEAHGYNWLSLVGGRMPNPYVSTDLLWDEDLNFDGVAATLHGRVGAFGAEPGDSEARHQLFATLGGFAVDEAEIAFPDDSSNDKWLLGAQLAYLWNINEHNHLQLAVALYDFVNIAGRRNQFGSELRDWTAPGFLEKGNTMFDIRNDSDPSTELFALAADFSIADAVAQYKFTGFDPIEVSVTADFLSNVAFDSDEILQRTGRRVSGRTSGYSLEMEVGRPNTAGLGAWAVFGGYKYLQRDAVLDAFTDSDFHSGGTDAKGYVLGARVGLAENTWFRLKWLSADEIDGPPLGLDVLQLDFNARF